MIGPSADFLLLLVVLLTAFLVPTAIYVMVS